MASTRIREARESDCGDIMRMIRVKTAVWKTVPGALGRVRNEGVPLDPVLRDQSLPALMLF